MLRTPLKLVKLVRTPSKNEGPPPTPPDVFVSFPYTNLRQGSTFSEHAETEINIVVRLARLQKIEGNFAGSSRIYMDDFPYKIWIRISHI